VRLGAIVLALYLAFLAVLFWQQRSLLYPASTRRATVAEAGLAGFQDVTLRTGDGEELVAWWKPPEPGRAVLVYFHGNGGTLWNRRHRARALTEAGHGLLLISYRGYSGSTGLPSESGLREDARTAYAYVAQRYEAPRIGLYGESHGTGVAVRLATERPVGGVILDAPYTSTADIAQLTYWFVPVRLLLLDQYPSIDLISQLKAPLLVVHGESDNLIPITFGEKLFGAAPEPKRFVRLSGVRHSDVLEQGGLEPVRNFLREVEGRGPA
jgi:fermentation-respiration switch protein FrsA (DUF1100 family)